MANLKPKSKSKKKKASAVKKAEPVADAPASSVPAFSVGDRVHHPMFGDGKIESIAADKLTITFEGNVTKEIRNDFVTRTR
jgi:hypothetical protein